MNCVHQLRPPHPPPRGRTEGDAEAVESGGQGSRPAPLRAQRRFLIGNAVTGRGLAGTVKQVHKRSVL